MGKQGGLTRFIASDDTFFQVIRVEHKKLNQTTPYGYSPETSGFLKSLETSMKVSIESFTKFQKVSESFTKCKRFQKNTKQAKNSSE